MVSKEGEQNHSAQDRVRAGQGAHSRRGHRELAAFLQLALLPHQDLRESQGQHTETQCLHLSVFLSQASLKLCPNYLIQLLVIPANSVSVSCVPLIPMYTCCHKLRHSEKENAVHCTNVGWPRTSNSLMSEVTTLV